MHTNPVPKAHVKNITVSFYKKFKKKLTFTSNK